MLKTARVEKSVFGALRADEVDQDNGNDATDCEEDFPIEYYIHGLFECTLYLTKSYIALYQTQPRDEKHYKKCIKYTEKFLKLFNGMKDKFLKDNHSLQLASGGFDFHFPVAEWHCINNLFNLYTHPAEKFGFDDIQPNIEEAEKYQKLLDEFESDDTLLSSNNRKQFFKFFLTGYKAKHMHNPFNSWILFDMPDKDYVEEEIYQEYEDIIKETDQKGCYVNGNIVYDGWNFSAFKPTPATYQKQIFGYVSHSKN